VPQADPNGAAGVARRPGGYVQLMMFLLKFLHSPKPDGRAARVEWKVVSTASGLLAGAVARKAVAWAWGRMSPTDHEPPLNPADRDVGWGEAISWSIAAGVGVGVARVVSDRLAAGGWELATGQPPPGVRPR